MSYKIGIIGLGVVGSGMARLFGEEVVTIYDEAKGFKPEKKEFNETDLTIICVPTNTSKEDDMSCDTSIVESSLTWLNDIFYPGIILIKSAVVPSEISRFVQKFPNLRICVSPEYLGESKYFTPFWKYPDPNDMRGHTWQVYGGERQDTSFLVDIFKRKMSVDTVHIQTNIMTAALCKYMENSFFATKVTFCNEWFNIAKAYGVDYNELRECWLADPRINRNHTLVFPRERGYGGKCFPKDVKAIIKDVEKRGYKANLMMEVNRSNNQFRQMSERSERSEHLQEGGKV